MPFLVTLRQWKMLWSVINKPIAVGAGRQLLLATGRAPRLVLLLTWEERRGGRGAERPARLAPVWRCAGLLRAEV